MATGRDDERRHERETLVAQEPQILDHADAGRDEQKRKRGEQSARRLAKVARRQRLRVERPPAPEDGERDDENRKPDHPGR